MKLVRVAGWVAGSADNITSSAPNLALAGAGAGAELGNSGIDDNSVCINNFGV